MGSNPAADIISSPRAEIARARITDINDLRRTVIAARFSPRVVTQARADDIVTRPVGIGGRFPRLATRIGARKIAKERVREPRKVKTWDTETMGRPPPRGSTGITAKDDRLARLARPLPVWRHVVTNRR